MMPKKIQERYLVSINQKTRFSQGDYLELAARVKLLEHKVEPKWAFITTFIIILLGIILLPILFIFISEQYITESNGTETKPSDVSPLIVDSSAPVDEDTITIQSIAEGILAEWNINIWSDLQKLFR